MEETEHQYSPENLFVLFPNLRTLLEIRDKITDLCEAYGLQTAFCGVGADGADVGFKLHENQQLIIRLSILGV